MRRPLVAAAWVSSVVAALVVGLVIGAWRSQVAHVQRDAEARKNQALVQAQDQLISAMQVQTEQYKAHCPLANLPGDSQLGDYPPEPPFGRLESRPRLLPDNPLNRRPGDPPAP